MKATTTLSVIVALTLGLLVAASPASAEVISYNWQGHGGGLGINGIPAATSAGFVPAINWNNFATASQPAGGTGSLLNLKDSSAAATTLDIGWTNNLNNFSADAVTVRATGNEMLFNAYMRTSTATAMTLSVSQIPYEEYTLYAYFGLHVLPRTGTLGLDGVTRSVTAKEAGTWTSWQEVTSAGGTGNYSVWTGLTNDSLVLTVGGPMGLYGFQIVDTTPVVPAPAALPAGLAMLGLIAARRRTPRRR